MSLYNYVVALDLKCPRCGSQTDVRAEARLGRLALVEYRLGDEVEWARNRAEGMTRPDCGTASLEGYGMCSVCHKDFWLSITVKNDLVASVSVDSQRPGLLS